MNTYTLPSSMFKYTSYGRPKSTSQRWNAMKHEMKVQQDDLGDEKEWYPSDTSDTQLVRIDTLSRSKHAFQMVLIIAALSCYQHQTTMNNTCHDLFQTLATMSNGRRIQDHLSLETCQLLKKKIMVSAKRVAPKWPKVHLWKGKDTANYHQKTVRENAWNI